MLCYDAYMSQEYLTPETWARCYAWFCSVTMQRQV